MNLPKTWLITGVSSRFGQAIASAALEAGEIVVGTVRNDSDVTEFVARAPGRARGILLDVTDHAAIEPAVHHVEAKIGPLDVLVNSAGYVHEGVIEESSIEDMRRQFEVNVFGAVAVTKAVIPFMRRRRSGRIVNITSMGGITTMPALGYYHASKFALEGFSETLGKEMARFGIKVTAVEPGSFRTYCASRSMVRALRAIPDYDALMNPIRDQRRKVSGHQVGDPRKAAAAILQLVAADNPPTHLLLGSDAAKLFEEKVALLQDEFNAWRDITLSTDFL